MRNFIVLFSLLTFLSGNALAQGMMQSQTNLRGGLICPAPELVAMEILLDDQADKSLTKMVAPMNLGGTRTVLKEPKNSDEVRDQFDSRTGRLMQADEFFRAVIPADEKHTSCMYTSSALNPTNSNQSTGTIIIMTKSRQCAPASTSWETTPSGEGYTCDKGRTACAYRCVTP